MSTSPTIPLSVSAAIAVAFAVAPLLASSPAAAQTTMQQQQADGDNDDDGSGDDDAEQVETVADDDTDDRGAPRRRSSAVDGPDAPGEDEDYVGSEWTIGHLPGFRLDFGFDFDDTTNLGLGLGYMAALNWRIQVLQSELLLRAGAGPDLTFVTGTDDGFDGATGYITGRITGSGPRGGMTIESGFGGGLFGAGFVPSFKIGAFYSTETFDIGYFYQGTVFDFRPDWITPHQIGLRLHIPLIEH